MASTFTDKSTRELLGDAFSGDKERTASGRSGLLSALGSLRKGKDKLEGGDLGKAKMLAVGAIAADPKHAAAMAAYAKNGEKGEGIDDLIAEYRGLSGDYTASAEEVLNLAVNATAAGMKESGKQAEEKLAEVKKNINERASMDRKTAVSTGIMEVKDGKYTLTAATKKARASLSKEAQKALEISDAAMNLGSDDAAGYAKAEMASNNALAALSEGDLRAVAKTGGAQGDAAAYFLQTGQRYSKDSKGAAGEAGAIAKSLGIELSGDQAKSLKGKNAKEQISEILRIGGISDDTLASKLSDTLGGKGTAAEKARDVRSAIGGSDEAKKKIEESKAGQGPQDPNTAILNKIAASLSKIESGVRVSNATEIGEAAGKGGKTETPVPASGTGGGH